MEYHLDKAVKQLQTVVTRLDLKQARVRRITSSSIVVDSGGGGAGSVALEDRSAASAGAVATIPVVSPSGYVEENGAATGPNFSYNSGAGFGFPDYAYSEPLAHGGLADGAGTSVANDIGWTLDGPLDITIHTFDYGATPVTYRLKYGPDDGTWPANTVTGIATGDELISVAASGPIKFFMDSFSPPGTKLGFDGVTVMGDGTFWVDAPFVVDGDDATLEPVYGEQTTTLRVVLAAPYEIARARLRIAIENAGAVSYAIQAATLADFSDATTVATMAFTATGSYTAQDVEVEWASTGAFRYWQLVGPAENRGIHSFELYEAVVDLGISDHGSLSGLADDDHNSYLLRRYGGGDDTFDMGTIGASATADIGNASVFYGTLDQDATITTTGWINLRRGTIGFEIENDGTSVPTFAGVTWIGAAPTADTAGTVTHVVLWSRDGGTTIWGAVIGGGGIEVDDEGTPLTTALASLDFVGAGVTVTNTGDAVTVTIPGGSVAGVVFPIVCVFDAGADAISGNPEVDVVVPANGTIVSWTLLADASGNAVIDIWKDTYANYPPTVGDSITGAEKPTLSGVVKNQDTSLNGGAGWAISAGDILRFHIDSSSTVKRLELTLLYARS